MNTLTCPELTGLQKFVGFVDLMGVLQIGAIIAAVICVCILFKNWLVPLFVEIPATVYEVLGYLTAFGLIGYASQISTTNQLWFTLGGCALLAGMVALTTWIHQIEEGYESTLALILAAIFSAVALFYHTPVVGFFAVTALMVALGFFGAVVQCGYVVGFADDGACKRGTTAALIILAGTVFEKINHLVLTPNAFEIFESGGLWMGSLVGFLGLLILSSKWYGHKRGMYIVSQIMIIAIAVAALVVGALWDISVLRRVAGTFFVLYLIEKPFEIPMNSISGHAAMGLVVSGAVGAGIYWAQNHLDVIKPYLLF